VPELSPTLLKPAWSEKECLHRWCCFLPRARPYKHVTLPRTLLPAVNSSNNSSYILLKTRGHELYCAAEQRAAHCAVAGVEVCVPELNSDSLNVLESQQSAVAHRTNASHRSARIGWRQYHPTASRSSLCCVRGVS